jgi:hypothetical protein
MPVLKFSADRPRLVAVGGRGEAFFYLQEARGNGWQAMRTTKVSWFIYRAPSAAQKFKRNVQKAENARAIPRAAPTLGRR